VDARDQLRLLSREMELQRAWLTAYLDDREARAAWRRSNAMWQLLWSVAGSRSLWVAAFGAALEWWRQRRRRSAPA
jgi:hypothetical protein